MSLLELAGVYNEPLGAWAFASTVGDPDNVLPAWEVSSDDWQRHASSPEMALALFLYNDLPSIDPATRLPLVRYFPERGLVYIRTGSPWAGNSDIQFAFEASPCINPSLGTYSVKHDQPDKNSITLSAFGSDFLVDPGYEHPRPEDHNLVLIGVDRRGEAVGSTIDSYGVEHHEPSYEHNGNIIEFTQSTGFEFIHGDATSSYGNLYARESTSPSPRILEASDPIFHPPYTMGYCNPVQWAHRRVLSLRSSAATPQYFVVFDDIRKNDDPQVYQWNFITLSAPTFSGSSSANIPGGGANATRIWCTSSGTVSTTSLSKGPYWQNGFVTTAIDPYFHAVILPITTGISLPTALTVSATNGSCWKLEWADVIDYSLSGRGGTTSGGGIITDSPLSMLRIKRSDGLVISYSIAEGSFLKYSSDTLLTLFGQSGTAMLTGSTLDVVGSSITHFRAFAPNVAYVMLNGEQVEVSRDGSVVEFPAIPGSTPSVISNGDFSSGDSSWSFFSNEGGTFGVVSGEGRVEVSYPQSNTQLYQTGFALQPNTDYRLTFDAYSSTGNDLEIIVHQHSDPYTNYGVDTTVNLGTSSQTYTIDFRTIGFSSPTNDTRLRFWFPSFGGGLYHFDNIGLAQRALFKRSAIFSEVQAPSTFRIDPCFPNPFNPSTTIRVGLPENSRIRLSIYDLLGQLVGVLVDKEEEAGYHQYVWNASGLASGVYLARLEAITSEGIRSHHESIRMLLTK